MADDDFKINWEIITDADVPQEKILAGPVRVQVWRGASQQDAVLALNQLAEYFGSMNPDDWQRLIGK